jgi:septum site-determining protein MinC
VSNARQPIRFLGRSYMAFVFTPEAPIADWLTELDSHIARSPNFFAGRPVVLDVAGLGLNAGEIANLIAELGRRHVRIMGLEGADPAAILPGMPPVLHHTRARSVQELTLPIPQPKAKAQVQPEPQPEPAPRNASLLIEQPVRSGQAIVFDGDITVLGSVGSAAELVAGGSIHIYGTLRGRVMAGCAGNPRARIFCQKIDAELIGINGYYRTTEEIDDSLRNRPAQAWLDGDDMKITALQ